MIGAKIELIGGIFEFCETSEGFRHEQIQKQIEKLLPIEKINKIVSEEDFLMGKNHLGYDKCYVDCVFKTGDSTFRVHLLRRDLGDGTENVTINSADIAAAKKVLKDFLNGKKYYSCYVKLIERTAK